MCSFYCIDFFRTFSFLSLSTITNNSNNTFDSPTFVSYRCFFNDVVKRQILTLMRNGGVWEVISVYIGGE